jgi:hypothetical protein
MQITFRPVAASLSLSGFMFLMTHTAAITSLIGSGGFFIDFTRVMSVGLSVLSAATASAQNW